MIPRLRYLNPLAGGFVWLSIVAVKVLVSSPADSLTLLLLFAGLVITPLAMRKMPTLAQDGRQHGIHRAVVVLQLPAALFLVAATTLEPGASAAVLALPWLLLTTLLAAFGFLGLLNHRPGLAEIVVNFGFMYVLVGGVWIIISRTGLQLLDFREPIITLTAVHFHYISLAALVLTGLVGQSLRQKKARGRRLYQLAAIGMVIGPTLVAVGITFSLLLESIAAVLLALSLSVVAFLGLKEIVAKEKRTLRNVLLAVSFSSVLFTMFFAAAYALGRLISAWQVSIPTMIVVHGWVNALGFSLCGLAAWDL